MRAARAAGYYNAGTVEFLVDQRPPLLLPGNEHAPAGGASRDRAGDRVSTWCGCRSKSPRASALPLHAGTGRVARCGHRMPHLCRRPVQRFPALARQNHAPDAPARSRACASMAAFTRAGPCPWNTIRCWPSWPSGPARAKHAIARMIRALREYDVGGIRTNIGFFRQILEDAEFRAGQPAHRLHRRIFRPPLAVRAAAPDIRPWRRWRRRLHTLARNGSRADTATAAPGAAAGSTPAGARCCDET